MARRGQYLQGLPELRKKLEKLRTDTAPHVTRAMEIGADKMVAMAKRLVPVDSGDLKDSIAWTWGEAPKGSIKIASAKSGRSILTIFAGDENSIQARWIEFGTAPRTNGGQYAGTQHPGTPPQPYFYPSWRASKREIQKLLRKAIRDAVKQAAK